MDLELKKKFTAKVIVSLSLDYQPFLDPKNKNYHFFENIDINKYL
jgi:hypothetical protein